MKFILALFISAAMFAQTAPPAPAPATPKVAPSKEETIAHLNDLVAMLMSQNNSLRVQLQGVKAEVDDPLRDQVAVQKLQKHMASLQAECQRVGQSLAVNQNSGGALYLPDENGLPYCTAPPAPPAPPKTEETKKAQDTPKK
jgi:hypothetical protein